MAVEKGAKTAVVWLLFTLPLSLLEGGVTRGKGVALNGPLKWPSRSPPLTHGHGLHGSLHVQGAWGCGHGLVARRGAKFPALRLYALTELLIGLSALAVPYEFAIGREIAR